MKNMHKRDVIPISILMSVYNDQDVLAGAVESILKQTFSDFEFIIVDDGSSDNTRIILKSYASCDRRIRLFFKENSGLTKSLNFGAKFALGEYIARQDADDISLPTRLEKQFAFISSRPDIALLGTNAFWCDGSRQLTGRFYTEQQLKSLVFRQNPFAHTSVMFRAESFRELGGYNEHFYTSQDFELWMRFAKKFNVAMLSDCLVKRVNRSTSISRRKRFQQIKNAFVARKTHSPSGWVEVFSTSLYQLVCAFLPETIVSIYRRINRRYVVR